jgi:hypothetical protein
VPRETRFKRDSSHFNAGYSDVINALTRWQPCVIVTFFRISATGLGLAWRVHGAQRIPLSSIIGV